MRYVFMTRLVLAIGTSIILLAAVFAAARSP